MPLGLAPLTELEAINEILATGADAPVSTLEDAEVIDASLARNTLRATSVEVQTRGWTFNTDEGLEIKPDQTGRIILPRNTLKVVAPGYTQRGTKLYDRVNRTFTFTEPVPITLVTGLEFDELPSTARMYITIRAARKYQDRYFGDDAQHSYNARDEEMALAALKDDDIVQSAANMLEDSQFNQNLRSRV